MAEFTTEKGEVKELLHFRQEVQINELPYIFEGDIPEKPDDFEWFVSIPDYKVERAGIEERIKNGDLNPNFESHYAMYDLVGPRVGILDIDKVQPKDQAPSIGVSLIASHTEHFALYSSYYEAKGIGSFLLDNLCALVDIKGWRIYLAPSDRGWGLGQSDLVNWYKRRGFRHSGEFSKDMRASFGGMQRTSQVPNRSQVIIGILNSHGVNLPQGLNKIIEPSISDLRPFVRSRVKK